MQIPTTFGDLAVKILTDVVFLGLVSALLTGGLWWFLEGYTAIRVPANWKRLGSLLMPFLLTGAFYLIQAGRGELPWSIEAYYSVFLAALGAAAGKQLAFTGYTAAKSGAAFNAAPLVYRPGVDTIAPPPAGVSFDTGPSAKPGEHNYVQPPDLTALPPLPGKEETHDGQ